MEKNLKICLVVPYFERPKMFLNAINSFKRIEYDNWEIRIIDDGSIKSPVKPILENELPKNILEKIIVYNTNDTIDNKLKRGSIHGQYMNLAFKESDADIFCMMSDDDAVFEEYFKNLNLFYSNNLEINYSYSHIIAFDPFVETPEKDLLKTSAETRFWNTNATTNLNHIVPLNPYCRVDSTQVSWRSICNKVHNVWFPDNQTKNLDASFYEQMFRNFGNCQFNGFISMYKGFHQGQLGNRNGKNQYEPIDL